MYAQKKEWKDMLLVVVSGLSQIFYNEHVLHCD